LTGAIAQVNTDFQALQATAKDEFGTEVTAVSNSIAELKTAVQNVSTGGVAAVVTAAQQVVTDADKLATDVDDQKC